MRRIERRYRPGTLVLETTFETDEGAVTLIDFMPPRQKHPTLVRIVVGQRGTVPMRLQLVIRNDYGSIVPWVRRTEDGLRAVAGPDMLSLHTALDLRGEELTTVADFDVHPNEQIPCVLVWQESAAKPADSVDPAQSLADTTTWWEHWSGQCTYQGRWKEAVVRSLVTLKALTYHPTGGIVAAATTSLPEQMGGVRNWDYRFCWVRDATFTLYSLLLNGYTREATAWREWLLRAVAGTPSQMNILYGVRGERRLDELELDWLPGYENSKPVRIGNAAYQQVQLDVFGEVLDAMYLGLRSGIDPQEDAGRVMGSLLGFLETAWNKPDEGIWEIRGPRRNFTHSKVMVWVAFDRMIKIIEQFRVAGPVDRYRALRHADSRRNLPARFRFQSQYVRAALRHQRAGRQPVDDPAGRLFAGRRPARGRHRGRHRARLAGRRLRAPLPDAFGRRRPAARRRGLFALHVLAGRQLQSAGPPGRGRATLRAAAGVAERRGPAGRRVRPGSPAVGGQLSAGLFAREPDQLGRKSRTPRLSGSSSTASLTWCPTLRPQKLVRSRRAPGGAEQYFFEADVGRVSLDVVRRLGLCRHEHLWRMR